jgi:hypothetical protein
MHWCLDNRTGHTSAMLVRTLTVKNQCKRLLLLLKMDVRSSVATTPTVRRGTETILQPYYNLLSEKKRTRQTFILSFLK